MTNRYVGTCPTSGCKVTKAVEVGNSEEDPNGQLSLDLFGESSPVKKTVKSSSWFNSSKTPKCPTHRRALKWEPVKGTYSAGRRCDSRCMYARGPDCECQCGGASHGIGWVTND